MANRIWGGWGSSQIVEEGNKELRHREDKDTTNKVLKLTKQWDILRSSKLIARHGREEVATPEDDPQLHSPELVDKTLFRPTKHELT
eukprot:2056334-Lingulodinium_polyedra.AAC.1